MATGAVEMEADAKIVPHQPHEARHVALVFRRSGEYNQPMNPLIVTIIIALATFIISIFGASWLNQQAMNKRFDEMNKRIDDLRSYLDARFAAIEQTMNARFDAVNARFDAVDARFDAVDARFDAVDNRISNLEQRVERIERQLDAIFKPALPKS